MARGLLQLFGWLLLSGQLLLGSASGALLYRHEKPQNESGQPLSIHILEIDPKGVCLRPVAALNEALGRETVSSIAQRSAAQAAVNGGFFRIGGRHDGLPAGILKIGSDWYGGTGKLRAALGWRSDGSRPLIEPLQVHWELRVEGDVVPLSGLNLPRGNNSAVLYSSAYHRTSLTDPDGFEAQIHHGQVVATGKGDSVIPEQGFVYSAGPSRSATQRGLKPGQQVEVRTRFEARGPPQETERHADWEEMDFIVGGAGKLLQDGLPKSDFAPEEMVQSFIDKQHPRTAVGWRPDGKWVAVVVDGRQPGLSAGMTLAELARLMHSLGCVEAINLDGGGSSTFYFQGKVRNSPSDFGKERPVSDAIVFIEKPCEQTSRKGAKTQRPEK